MVKDYSLFRRADPTSNDNTSLLASAPRVQKNIHRLRVKWDNRDPLFDRTSLFIINPFARVFKMGFASAMIGGGLGVGVQMFSNYTLKIPISRSKFGFPFPVCVCCCCFVLFCTFVCRSESEKRSLFWQTARAKNKKSQIWHSRHRWNFILAGTMKVFIDEIIPCLDLRKNTQGRENSVASCHSPQLQ